MANGATWAKVFYHNAGNSTVYFASDAEVLNANSANKYSILNYLECYRRVNTQFEFMLEYPEIAGQYNRWTQTSNPVTSAPHVVTNYAAVGTPSWTAYNWGGLARTMNPTMTFIDGSTSAGTGSSLWYYSIGNKQAWSSTLLGIPGPLATPMQQVELWVRVDNLATP